MNLEALTTEKIPDFIAFCRRHRHIVDDSYLYDDQLERFRLDEDSPTYLVTGEDARVIAAASLVLDEYHRLGNRARFRILHSEVPDPSVYSRLMDALTRHRDGLDHYFLYLRDGQEAVAEILEDLGFQLERYAFSMVREDGPVWPCRFPDGYEVRPFRPGLDEKAWCHVRNRSFATLKGSETPMTEEMVREMNAEGDAIEGGLFLLCHGEMPVGVVRGFMDEHEGVPAMGIGPLALLPEYQGKGLGTLLLRHALAFARQKAYRFVILSVNGENLRAKDLYLREGFRAVQSFACYTLAFRKD